MLKPSPCEKSPLLSNWHLYIDCNRNWINIFVERHRMIYTKHFQYYLLYLLSIVCLLWHSCIQASNFSRLLYNDFSAQSLCDPVMDWGAPRSQYIRSRMPGMYDRSAQQCILTTQCIRASVWCGYLTTSIRLWS